MGPQGSFIQPRAGCRWNAGRCGSVRGSTGDGDAAKAFSNRWVRVPAVARAKVLRTVRRVSFMEGDPSRRAATPMVRDVPGLWDGLLGRYQSSSPDAARKVVIPAAWSKSISSEGRALSTS